MNIYSELKKDNPELVKGVNKDALFVAACSLGKERIVKALLPKMEDTTLGLQEALIFGRDNIVDILKKANYNKEKISRLAHFTKKLNEKVNSLGIKVISKVEDTAELKELKEHYVDFLVNPPKNLRELFKQAVGDKNKFALRLARIIHSAIGEEEFKGEILKDTSKKIDESEVFEILDEVESYLDEANTYLDKVLKSADGVLSMMEGEEAEMTEDELELALTPAKIKKNISKEAIRKFEELPPEVQEYVQTLEEIHGEWIGRSKEFLEKLNEVEKKFSLEMGTITNRDLCTKVRSKLIERIYPKLKELDAKVIDLGEKIMLIGEKAIARKVRPASIDFIIKEINRLKSEVGMEEITQKGDESINKMVKLIEGISSLLEKAYPTEEEETKVYTEKMIPREQYKKPVTPTKETEEIEEEKLF